MPEYAKVTSWLQTPTGNEAEMKKALASKGVIAVTMDIEPIQFYKGGIFNGAGCSSAVYDFNTQKPMIHAMALVGYTPSYLLIRNSWDSKTLKRIFYFKHFS